MSKVFSSFRSELEEKTLTPAEKKKREEVAKAIERENLKMPMGMKMAIATKTAKRVAEETIEEQSTDDEDKIDYRAPGVKKLKDGKYWAKNKSGTMKIFDKEDHAKKHAASVDKSKRVAEEVEQITEGDYSIASTHHFPDKAMAVKVKSHKTGQMFHHVGSPTHLNKTLKSKYKIRDNLMWDKNRVKTYEEVEIVDGMIEEAQKLDELKKSTVVNYLHKTVDPVYGLPKAKAKLAQRIKGIQRAHERIVGNKPTSSVKEAVDDEGAMAKGQLMRMVNQASGLARIMNDDTQLDGWVQSKLTLASDYLDSVHDFLMHSKQDVEDDEESEMQKEEVEQVDELNKSTVDSYLKKAVDPAYGDFGRRPKTKTKLAQRIKGIHNAHIRMLGIKPTSSVKEDVHYCAKHVRSHLLGDGVVLEAQHADPNDEGQIEWYMVEFKDGIHKVFTDDLEIMIAEYHGNHKKKKRMKDG